MIKDIEYGVKQLSFAMTVAVKILQCHVLEKISACASVTITQTMIKHCIDIVGGFV